MRNDNSLQAAFNAGYQAYFKYDYNNPFDPSLKEYHEWNHGHICAQLDEDHALNQKREEDYLVMD